MDKNYKAYIKNNRTSTAQVMEHNQREWLKYSTREFSKESLQALNTCISYWHRQRLPVDFFLYLVHFLYSRTKVSKVVEIELRSQFIKPASLFIENNCSDFNFKLLIKDLQKKGLIESN